MSIQRLRAKDGPLGINNHELIHARINIVEEFHRRVVFGSLFPRHHSGYNKRCNQLSKLLRKHADVNPISPSDHMTRNK